MSEIDPKLSRLYREASSESPPAALDAAILAAAKQAAAQRRPARSSWVRWMAPASALATLLVAVSLAFLMQREQPGIIDETSVRETAPRPQPDRATEATKAKAADSTAEKKEAPAAAARGPAAAPPSPAAPSPSQQPPRSMQAAPPLAPAQALRSAETARPAAEAVPAESRAKSGSPAMARESNAASDSAGGGLGAASAGAPAAPAAAGKLAPLRQQALPRTPQAWLEEIARLKRAGRDQEAAEQLAEFRKAYPAHAVPEHLLK